MKIAVFAVLPAAALAAGELAGSLSARGHDAFQRSLASFDGQSEGADMYVLMLSKAQAKAHEEKVKLFTDIFAHRVTGLELEEVENEESRHPSFVITGLEEFLEEFGSEAPPPAEALNILQSRAVELGVPFGVTTSAEDLATAIEQKLAQGDDDDDDDDNETEEQQQLRQRLEALPDDKIREVAKEEFEGKTFPANAKTETMIDKLVEALGEKEDEDNAGS